LAGLKKFLGTAENQAAVASVCICAFVFKQNKLHGLRMFCVNILFCSK